MITRQRHQAGASKRHHCRHALINIGPTAPRENTTLGQPDTEIAETKQGGLVDGHDRAYISGRGYRFDGLIRAGHEGLAKAVALLR